MYVNRPSFESRIHRLILSSLAGTISRSFYPLIFGDLIALFLSILFPKFASLSYQYIKKEYLKTRDEIEEIEEINKIPKNSGLKLIGYFPAQECSQKDIMCVQKTGPIDVYEIDAVAIKPELKEK